MKHYEVTFIVDPVLANDQVKGIADKYIKFLTTNKCDIVHVDEMGLRQLAYPIGKRNSGVYYCVEFETLNGGVIGPLELNMRRDEQLLRFLTVSLDKYGVKYNADKRAGLIGKKKKPATTAAPVPAPAHRALEPEAEVITEKPAPKVVEAEPAAPVAADSDDLKKIEGIGPKIEELLNAAGILTFAQLAATDADHIRGILADAGSRFTMHDPATWGEQAALAADGNWAELQSLQDKLQGGKEADASSEEE